MAAPLCWPNDTCQVGEEGDPCAELGDCSAMAEFCGPDNQCHDGSLGDPCAGSQCAMDLICKDDVCSEDEMP